MKNFKFLTLFLLLAAAVACRKDDVVFVPEVIPTGPPEFTSVEGFYLLNEGNMGSNKSTLDYYDYTRGEYLRNIYGNANPEVPKELGDVGNDLKIYGSRLYAVINCSNKVEVMNAADARRIGQVDIPNCRSIDFDGRFAYVTSYAGPVEINPDYQQKGFVAKVDTATLEVVGRCVVGFQPDGLAITGGKIYVANSGGYRVPNYEKTVSVIDLKSFTLEGEFEVAENLQYIVEDSQRRLWISTRGDYYDQTSRIFCYDPEAKRLVKDLDVPVNGLWVDGDSIYTVANGWSYETMSEMISYAIIDTRRMEKVCDNFISDGSEKQITRPYGVAVNPLTKEIYVTDARTYVNPGYLYCFSPDGRQKWRVRTGDIPAHFAFKGTLK